jgi:hypothetical protein
MVQSEVQDSVDPGTALSPIVETTIAASSSNMIQSLVLAKERYIPFVYEAFQGSIASKFCLPVDLIIDRRRNRMPEQHVMRAALSNVCERSYDISQMTTKQTNDQIDSHDGSRNIDGGNFLMRTLCVTCRRLNLVTEKKQTASSSMSTISSSWLTHRAGQ